MGRMKDYLLASQEDYGFEERNNENRGNYDMENYKLLISNIMCNVASNNLKSQMNVTEEMMFVEINSFLKDLNLDIDEWARFIIESVQGHMSKMKIQNALSQYAYEKASKINSNPTFPQVWVEIIEFINYFNFGLEENIFIELEYLVDNLTKNSIKKEYSWDKRVVARLIVKKGMKIL